MGRTGMTRREFAVMTAAGAFAGRLAFGEADPGERPLVRFGLVTDLHYADIPPRRGRGAGSRYFRDSLRKLEEAVGVFNARRLDFAAELGDLKDNTRGHDGTIEHLEKVEAAFARFSGPRYHVAGNHDFDCISPSEFFSRTPNGGKVAERGWYSFAAGGVTFIALNACFTSRMEPYSGSIPWDWTDSNVPPEELDWFGRELAAARGHVVVMCHQRLENSAERHHIVRNAAAVRALIERSGKVRAVIMGHEHCGGLRVLNGIPYYTLSAMVCCTGKGSNCFAEGAIYPSGAFTVTGWQRARSFDGRAVPPGGAGR